MMFFVGQLLSALTTIINMSNKLNGLTQSIEDLKEDIREIDRRVIRLELLSEIQQKNAIKLEQEIVS